MARIVSIANISWPSSTSWALLSLRGLLTPHSHTFSISNVTRVLHASAPRRQLPGQYLCGVYRCCSSRTACSQCRCFVYSFTCPNQVDGEGPLILGVLRRGRPRSTPDVPESQLTRAIFCHSMHPTFLVLVRLLLMFVLVFLAARGDKCCCNASLTFITQFFESLVWLSVFPVVSSLPSLEAMSFLLAMEKLARYCVPGIFHGGPAWASLLSQLGSSSGGSPWRLRGPGVARE